MGQGLDQLCPAVVAWCSAPAPRGARLLSDAVLARGSCRVPHHQPVSADGGRREPGVLPSRPGAASAAADLLLISAAISLAI
ncbi:protein of unknown function [Cyanobium sp. NIES-981]|nr:protein of unknown function [Cyanobium sp. NIES-981]